MPFSISVGGEGLKALNKILSLFRFKNVLVIVHWGGKGGLKIDGVPPLTDNPYWNSPKMSTCKCFQKCKIVRNLRKF